MTDFLQQQLKIKTYDLIELHEFKRLVDKFTPMVNNTTGSAIKLYAEISGRITILEKDIDNIKSQLNQTK